MTDSSNNRKDNNFNLLRLSFAILVIMSHSPELAASDPNREDLDHLFQTLSFGGLAVSGFFLLSGFLIVQSWNNAPRPMEFLRSRVLRIFPAFIVATLVCAFIVGPLAATRSSYFADFWIPGFIVGTLLLQPPIVPSVFPGTHYPVVNGAMWTISLEFVCYLGVLLAGLCGITRRRNAWFAFTICTSAVFIFHRFGLLGGVRNENFLSHPLLSLASFFLVGGCYCLFRANVVFDASRAVIAGVIIVVAIPTSLRELALLTAGGYLLFYFAFKPISCIANFHKLPDVSYGVYLYGWPVQKLLLWYVPTMSPWLLFALSCVLALLCGVVSWYAVEKPFLRFKSANRIASATPRLQPNPIPCEETKDAPSYAELPASPCHELADHNG